MESAVQAVMDDYPNILQALQKASSTISTSISLKVNGILATLSSGKTMLGLLSAMLLLR